MFQLHSWEMAELGREPRFHSRATVSHVGLRECQTEGTGQWEAVKGFHTGDWSWIKRELPPRTGAHWPPHPKAQLRQEELAFVLDESAQLFLKAQPYSSGLSRAEGIQLSQQVTSGVGGGSTLYTVRQHLQSYIITTRNNGLFKHYAMSCAASCSGNTIRPGKHYLLSITLEFGENKQINHPPITADWIKVSVKS